jgi:hypothetical protein
MGIPKIIYKISTKLEKLTTINIKELKDTNLLWCALKGLLIACKVTKNVT